MAERYAVALLNNADEVLNNGISFSDMGIDVEHDFYLARSRNMEDVKNLVNEHGSRHYLPLLNRSDFFALVATARSLATSDFEEKLPGSCVVYLYYLHDDLEQAFAFDRNGMVRELTVIRSDSW